MQTEKATYDPDLPHLYLVLKHQSHECGMCGRPRKDELHQMATERADHRRHEESFLQTEKGS